MLYPGLPAHPGHEIAARQMRDFGGMVSFLVESEEEAVALVARTKIWKLAESLGGVESLIEHPSRMTHASTADARSRRRPTSCGSRSGSSRRTTSSRISPLRWCARAELSRAPRCRPDMRKATFAAALIALAAIPTASAKGPTHAELTGPGLGHPIVFNGYGEGGGTGFGRFVEGVGWFPAMFGQQPSPMLTARPGGALGPAYSVRYRVPTGSRPATIVQTLYPFATGGTVVYTKPGQRLFGTATPGGWFRAAPFVKPMLVKRGLPATAPAATGSSGWPAWVAGVGAALLATALAAVGVSRLRRRPHATPA